MSPRRRLQARSALSIQAVGRASVSDAGPGWHSAHLRCGGVATDLVFLSHAKALAPGSSFSLSSRRAGPTVNCWPLRARSCCWRSWRAPSCAQLCRLVRAAFNLGGLRLALVPAGYLPGAASLLCEAGGRRLLYAGTISASALFLPAWCCGGAQRQTPCAWTPLGDPRFVLPPRERSGSNAAGGLWKGALAARRAPVLLVSALWPGASDGRSAAGRWHRRARSQHHRGGLGALPQAGAACRRCVVLRANWAQTRHCFGRRRRARPQYLARLPLRLLLLFPASVSNAPPSIACALTRASPCPTRQLL